MERTIYARQPDLMRTAHKAACTAEDGRRSEKTARQRRGDGGARRPGNLGVGPNIAARWTRCLPSPRQRGADRGAIPGAAMRKGRDVYGAAKKPCGNENGRMASKKSTPDDGGGLMAADGWTAAEAQGPPPALPCRRRDRRAVWAFSGSGQSRRADRSR